MITTMAISVGSGGSAGKIGAFAVSAICSLFAPISVFYYSLLFFLSINFISGVWDDLKKGEKFSWGKFKVFINRVLLYVIAVSVTWIFEKLIVNEFVINENSKYLTTIVTGMFSIYEIQSFLCNAASISGNKVFMRISEKIKAYFNKKSDAETVEEKAESKPIKEL